MRYGKSPEAPKVNLMGLYAGGVLSSMVCAQLSATGQLDQVNSLGLGVAVLDESHAGTTVALMDEGTAAGLVLASRARGYIDGRTHRRGVRLGSGPMT